jgi:hypothetical protein
MPREVVAKHNMLWTGELRIDEGGRKLKVCATCGKVNVGTIHTRGMRPVMGAYRSMFVGPAEDVDPETINESFSEALKPEPEAMVLLRIAVRQVLALDADAIGWRMRLRVLDVQKAFDIVGDLPLIEDVELPSGRTHHGAAPSRDSGAHLVRKSINGDFAKIGLRAVEAGWSVKRTGDQHFIFTRPDLGGVFTLPSTGGEGRGYRNAKASAKRAGLDVEGL